MSLLVKICGLSTRETLDVALQSGADMVGFVFFPPSPRHLSLEVARELGRHARGRAIKVALTVDADDATFGNIIDALRPDILQVHGKETNARLRDIKQKFGLPVMKALAVETPADLAALSGYAAVADRILFDAHPPRDATRPGGLGATFDWHVLEKLDLKLPFMVSGGLSAANVAEAIRVTGAGGVDVSSGVESMPGVKDPEMIRAFIRAARDAELASPLPASGKRSDRSCDPGEGEPPHLSPNSRQEPLTSTVSPQGRGEGAETARRRGQKK
jgi:phosphoribosylanthranilate isomerase